MTGEGLAGRQYITPYRVRDRHDQHRFILEAVKAGAGHVIFASSAEFAPVVVVADGMKRERMTAVIYAFRCNPPPILGRAADEHRVQLRYGGERSWQADHPLSFDPAGADVTLVLGVHLDAGLFIGLDPLLYDPLPMGISIEFRQSDVDTAMARGWHVWERMTRPGTRRTTSRSIHNVETLVAFRPERLLDYVRFERKASDVGLDSPLRFRAAEAAGVRPEDMSSHLLEEEFGLRGDEILDIIAGRRRLAVAVRGGVAEHHLERVLREDPAIRHVQRLDADGQPDFVVELADGRRLRIECKNVSPKPYQGAMKVEIQKTRSQRHDPAGRLYTRDQFDVVAASLFSSTGRWEFRFRATAELADHPAWPGRLAPIHRVDQTWTADVSSAIER